MSVLGPYLAPFFTLSYRVDSPPQNPDDTFPGANYYTTGPADLLFVVGSMALMAGIRDALRIFVFEPLAYETLTKPQSRLNGQANGKTNGHANGNGHVNGHASTKKKSKRVQHSVLRFAEQGYQLVWYTAIWVFGYYVHTHVPTSVLNPRGVWLDYPHVLLPGAVKLYYLLELAFYTHQMFVLNAEARRKDHVQMMTHHIITVFLMGLSYYCNFTRVGSLIMMLMDWCDILFPLAKMFRYIRMPQILTDAVFACFMVSWFVTRHVFFMIAIVSTVVDLPRIVPFNWDPVKGHYLSYGAHVVFCACLITLQILQLFWFGMICKVAYKVIMGQGAEDTRSDDEEEYVLRLSL
ncbi:longevity assurance proteins LAG1/LAC1 [Cylindrobasidium torrendii FP15055 ss-10]|uniref:Longevity assurance proteins LAG1/LAC1 n=1 Tax=Cylindrobasidium torrendii FP15055 ss-10 TaxID=1314674 RepID=A0A0D7BU14_9AGAR|nr:longevity assurance proteins LAG1/LAC1 [Cylindrobasidium torrendii FP15055 ss-10]